MSNLLNWALSQTFGKNYQTELETFVAGVVTSNPELSLEAVQALADAKAFDFFNAAAAKLPGYLSTFVEFVLTLETVQIDALINTNIADVYAKAQASSAKPEPVTEDESVSQPVAG